jgi:hypothetical protein
MSSNQDFKEPRGYGPGGGDTGNSKSTFLNQQNAVSKSVIIA